jgi:hypothetical protein
MIQKYLDRLFPARALGTTEAIIASMEDYVVQLDKGNNRIYEALYTLERKQAKLQRQTVELARVKERGLNLQRKLIELLS